MRYVLLCLNLFAACFVLQGQSNYIKGKVVQEMTGEAVAGASVFISGSTKGTVSKADGSFELTGVPVGNHELVISSIGYMTLVHSYTAADIPMQLEIQLKPKVAELATVLVEPDEADGWRKWGQLFKDNFIGTTNNATECKLKNPEVLRFRFSKKNNVLRVMADEPLVIENKALGYTLQYQLEEFTYDFRGRYLIFLGYPLFEDIPTDKERLKRKWAENRKRAYLGSIHHFMKSLYDNDLALQGFEVKRLIKKRNIEKERIRGALQARVRAQREKGGQAVINFGDSSEYYNKILSQPDQFEMVLPALLTADSLVTETGGLEKVLFFTDYLYITYKNEIEEEGYIRAFMEKRGAYHQRSTVFLPNLRPVTIDSRGNFSPLPEFISYGYWAWSEKIASLLPLDYK